MPPRPAASSAPAIDVPLLDHTTDLVAVVRDGHVVASSCALRDLLRLPAERLHGTPWEDLVHPDDRGVAASAGRVRVLDADGLPHVCDVHARVPSAAGDTLAVMREVVSTVEADRVAALLQRMTELANTTSDLDDVLLSAVRDVRATLGWDHGRVVRLRGDGRIRSRADWDPGPPADEPLPDAVLARARDPREPVVELVDVGGRPMQAVVVAVAAGDEAPDALLVWVTTPRPIESTTTTVLANIGWQLGLVAGRQADRWTLQSREDELERSNAELERFAYVASHDLQEPLRKVTTACELLARRAADVLQDRPDARAYVDIAVDASHRMQTLIRDLLAYSRIGRAADEPDDVDLGALVEEVLASQSSIVDELGATVVVDALPTVRARTSELRQVVANLVSNALKFHGAAPPQVVVAATDADDGMVEVTVTDNGIGIDPRFGDQVFEVFRRLHRIDQYAGTGIGLSIVKRVVEHHGGRVWLGTPDAGGTRVHLTLPRGGDTT